MINEGRRKDIEEELGKLGWTNKDWGCDQVTVFQEYRPNKKNNNHLPWEFCVYYKVPVWEWDFVEYQGYYTNSVTGIRAGMSYRDYNPGKGNWIHNERGDFEFASPVDTQAIAMTMDSQRRQQIESEVLDYKMWPWKIAVQRVEDRPTKEQLNG